MGISRYRPHLAAQSTSSFWNLIPSPQYPWVASWCSQLDSWVVQSKAQTHLAIFVEPDHSPEKYQENGLITSTFWSAESNGKFLSEFSVAFGWSKSTGDQRYFLSYRPHVVRNVVELVDACCGSYIIHRNLGYLSMISNGLEFRQ